MGCGDYNVKVPGVACRRFWFVAVEDNSWYYSIRVQSLLQSAGFIDSFWTIQTIMAQFRQKVFRIIFIFVIIFTSILVFLRNNLLKAELGMTSISNGTTSSHTRTVRQRHAVSSALAMKLPSATHVPRLVHFLWCGNRTFEFHNYLSIASSAFYINPDRVVVYYEHPPVIDRFYYNTWWFQELQDKIPNLELQRVGDTECHSEEHRLRFVRKVLLQDGGIYLGENTLLLNSVWPLLQEDFSHYLSSSTDGFLAASRTAPMSLFDTESHKECTPMTNVSVDAVCVILSKGIFPKDLWNWQGYLGKALNAILYGQESVPLPKRDTLATVPQIAHMLWLHGRDMDFLFYLSCLSLLHIVHVEYLFVHGNMEPIGRHWTRLKQDERVKFIHRPLPNVVFNQISHRPHHMSDIFRAEVMYKYGGIYSDVDVIWTQSISDQQRECDATAAYDWARNYPPYPAYINLGVAIAKPKSAFWKLVWSSMKHFNDDIFGFNGLLQPYKVFERDPSILCLDKHLQVMCYMEKCYPLWDVDYRHMDWQRDTHAFHFVYPTPVEFTSKEVLLNATGLWAEVGKHVLMSAGLID